MSQQLIRMKEESKNRFETRQKRGFETTQKMKCLRIFFWAVRKLSNLSYESTNALFFSFLKKKKNKKGLKSRIFFIDLFDILILYIDITSNHFFLEPYEEKTSYTFLGGVLFSYIYPNEPFIESLQLMFDPQEKEEIFGKWVFMIR